MVLVPVPLPLAQKRALGPLALNYANPVRALAYVLSPRSASVLSAGCASRYWLLPFLFLFLAACKVLQGPHGEEHEALAEGVRKHVVGAPQRGELGGRSCGEWAVGATSSFWLSSSSAGRA